MTPGLRLTQAVKPRQRGRVVRVEVRAVTGEPVACPYIVHLDWMRPSSGFERGSRGAS